MLRLVRERGRPRGDRTRRRIVEATLDVIAEEGVRAVTQRRVSAAANASVGLIAYHFSSTSSLITAALEQLAEGEAKRLAEVHARALELEDDVDGLAELLVDEVVQASSVRRRDVIATFALTVEIPLGTVERLAFDAWEEAQQELYRAIAAAAGAEDPSAIGDFLMASVDGLSLYAAIAPDPGFSDEAARAGFGQLLRSLGRSGAGSGAG
jgi:TetR/AcrR family transcriptional regulator, regulator of biofilm formation and stress response